MTVTIRTATPADIGTVHDFILALADYERLSHAVRTDRATLERHLFGARPHAEVLIAEHEGEAIGFALFFHSFSTFEGRPGIFLEDLFVAPEARGLGAGKLLLARLAQLCLERDCARLEWNVLDWNAPSIAFYDSLGARPVEGWIPYRTEGEALVALAAVT